MGNTTRSAFEYANFDLSSSSAKTGHTELKGSVLKAGCRERRRGEVRCGWGRGWGWWGGVVFGGRVIMFGDGGVVEGCRRAEDMQKVIQFAQVPLTSPCVQLSGDEYFFIYFCSAFVSEVPSG